jgi:hypothetical protein
VERIEGAILLIRGERVMLDADLAAVYGVTTKALNQAVKRNRDRFPDGFIFQLTVDEYAALRSQFVTSNEMPGRGGRRHLPFAFTEHGAVMLAALLKSKRAVEVSVFVVKAFIHMRRMLTDQRRFTLKLDEIEGKLASHDQNFKVVFDAIRRLMEKPKPEPEPPRKIGFHVSESVAEYGVIGKRRRKR